MNSPALVLVVDDEPDLELLIRQRFRKKINAGELEFDFAINGEEALKKLETTNRHFDMVLTDINMPVMDGLTLLNRIKEQEGPYKAVVVSAYGDLENIRTAMNRGAFDFITKPIDFTDLELTILKTVNEVRLIRKGLEAHEQLETTLQEKERAEIETDRARQSEKFKQQFLANMSHEIRTPMNSVVGLTHLLLKTSLNEQQLRYVDTIRKSSENLLVIINDILDVSKIEAGKMVFEKTAFVFTEIMDNLFQMMLIRSEEKKLSLELELSPEIPSVLIGDPVRLQQILINLVGNAIKFTEQGKVTITAVPVELDGVECKVRFNITDTGIGISPETVGIIFESFAQATSETNRKFGGTGLGLTISKQLIDLQGGAIDLASEVGMGTTFSFTLPFRIGEQSDLPKRQVSADADKISISGISVLLTEDNVFNQMVAIDTLKDLIPDVQIDVAENGAEALDILAEKSYDLILMDIQMPVMDGFETIQRIRSSNEERLRKVKIMAMTANVTRDEVDRCFESGVDDYIAKPFDPQDLLVKIYHLIHQKNQY
jgi:signal transduction histidine kinase